MKKNKLEKFFDENNQMMERFTIKSKIITRIIGFIICSICYPLLTLSKNYNSIYGDEVGTTSTVEYIKIIMLVCYIIGILGFIYLLLEIIMPLKIKKLTDKFSFDVKKKIFSILDWLLIIPVCCIVAVGIYSYLFVITPISGTSMNPTIEDGESVLVSYLDKVEQFDVVVIKVTPEDNFYPVTNDSYYIKRIIGMPGQKVTWDWSNSTLKIDNKIVDEFYYPSDYLLNSRNNEKKYLNDTQIESYNQSQSFDGLFQYKDENGIKQTTYIIPDGYYFVMGDNRTIGGSTDSRKIGLIPQKNIVGVAKYHVKGIFPYSKIA